jgi:methyl-accepting chemotaxis protein
VESDETTQETPAPKRRRTSNGNKPESSDRERTPAQNAGAQRRARDHEKSHNGKNGSEKNGASTGDLNTHLNQSHLNKLLKAMSAAGDGDFTVRLPVGPDDGILGKLAEKFNEVVERNEAMAREITRVEKAVRREGLMTERASLNEMSGGWG